MGRQSDQRPFFARQLEKLREAAGLSQYRLSQLAGLSKQAVSQFELGNRGPTFEAVQRIAMALDVSCDAFCDPDLELPAVAEPGKPGRPAR